jgi:hypothetical protein
VMDTTVYWNHFDCVQPILLNFPVRTLYERAV